MIRCLIVDDSQSFREVLRHLLSFDPQIQVVGEAEDGEKALELTRKLKPDVITLDVHMPKQNGLVVIRELMATQPLPIVVISAAAEDETDQISFQALSLGALEVMAKPRLSDPKRFADQAEELRRTLRTVAGIKPVRRTGQSSPAPELPLGARPKAGCVGLVASTGGPPALEKVLSALPGDFPAPILVVQHTADGFTAGLVSWLSGSCKLRLKLAEPGESLSPGTVYFAPDNRHLLTSLGRVRLDDGPKVRGFRPSGTVLLTALARDFGAGAAGVVLTGMGDDGAHGLKLIRERGGYAFAQGRASSVVWGMPRAAIEMGAAEGSLEVDHIAPTLIRIAARRETSGRRRRLLLVDDAEAVLLLEQHLLADRFELFLARNGQEALDSVERVRPDGILMDYSMPVMNGDQALIQLKQNPATSAIPVIMVTGESDPTVLKRCTDAGALALVKKPIDAKVLRQAVNAFL